MSDKTTIVNLADEHQGQRNQLGRITSSTGAAVLVLARIGNSILITPGVAVICLANPAHL